jgi:citrate lyase subunit beta/citryl-CoA lyase
MRKSRRRTSSTRRSVPARSYLYAPGHDRERVEDAFRHGADAVVLDLEDGVPPERRDEARAIVEETLATGRAWVRVNPAGTSDVEADVEAARGALGLRLPKVRSTDDVRWLVSRAGGVRLICSIENAEGLAAADDVAAVPGVLTLSLGSKDLTADLGCADDWEALLPARERLVAACRAAEIAPPVDSVYYADDAAGLRDAAEAARLLGFSGKSTLWPEQVQAINAAFSAA